MTNSLVRDVFRDFDKFSTIGLDRLFERAQALTYGNYPPSNLIEFSDQTYQIEVAVAGFSKDELTVKKEGEYLVVVGKQQSIEPTIVKKYLHRGIAARDFELKFLVAKYVEVKSVVLLDGILTIELENRLPEEEKARIFEIL
jgi:molecular chaperone IbpA